MTGLRLFALLCPIVSVALLIRFDQSDSRNTLDILRHRRREAGVIVYCVMMILLLVLTSSAVPL